MSRMDIWGGRDGAIVQKAATKQKQQHLKGTEKIIFIKSHIRKLIILQNLYSLFKFGEIFITSAKKN